MTSAPLASRLLRHYRREAGTLLLLTATVFGLLTVMEVAQATARDAVTQTVWGRAAGYAYVARASADDAQVETTSDQVVAMLARRGDATFEQRLVELDLLSVDQPAPFGHLLAGRRLEATGEVMISEYVADTLGVDVGDVIVNGGLDATVVGVYVYPGEPAAAESIRLDRPAPTGATASEWRNGRISYLVSADAPDRVTEYLLLTPSDLHLEGGPVADGGRLIVVLSRATPLVAVAGLLGLIGALVALGRARRPDLDGLQAAGLPVGPAHAVVTRAAGMVLLVGLIVGYGAGVVVAVVAARPLSGLLGQRWVTIEPMPIRLALFAALFGAGFVVLARSDLWRPSAEQTAVFRPRRLPGWAVAVTVALGAVAVFAPVPLIPPFRLALASLGAMLLFLGYLNLVPRMRARSTRPAVAKVIDRIDPLNFTNVQASILVVVVLSSAIALLPLALDASSGGIVPPRSMVVRNLTPADAEWLAGWYEEEVGGAATLYLSPLDDNGPARLRLYPGDQVECLRAHEGEMLGAAETSCVASMGELRIYEGAVGLGPPAGEPEGWRAKPELVRDGRVGLIIIGSDGRLVRADTAPAWAAPELRFNQLPGGIAPAGYVWPTEAPTSEGIVTLHDYTVIDQHDRSAVAYQLAGRLSYALPAVDDTPGTGPRWAAVVLATMGAVLVVASLAVWLAAVGERNRAVWSLVRSLRIGRRSLVAYAIGAVAPLVLAVVAAAASGPLLLRLTFGYPVLRADWISLAVMPVAVTGTLLLALGALGYRGRGATGVASG